MRIAFLGAGAWGTALAIHAARAHEVMLWARDETLVQAMSASGRNQCYLPEAELPSSMRFSSAMAEVARWIAEGHSGRGAEDSRGEEHQGESLVVVATSMAGLRPTLQQWARAVAEAGAAAVIAASGHVRLSKGIDPATGQLGHQLVSDIEGLEGAGAALSGPSFAQEVAAGLPAALTVAGGDASLNLRCVRALHHGAVRIYRSDDVLGVELGAALKNVVAIATGICDGLGLGANARAALITRGLAEIARLGAAMGAQPQTFMGLTGLGDLVLTCTGDLSRNRRVGLALAQGRTVDEAVASLGHVAEGVACVSMALDLARRQGVDAPIVEAVAAVIAGRMSPSAAVHALLSREARPRE